MIFKNRFSLNHCTHAKVITAMLPTCFQIFGFDVISRQAEMSPTDHLCDTWHNIISLYCWKVSYYHIHMHMMDWRLNLNIQCFWNVNNRNWRPSPFHFQFLFALFQFQFQFPFFGQLLNFNSNSKLELETNSSTLLEFTPSLVQCHYTKNDAMTQLFYYTVLFRAVPDSCVVHIYPCDTAG